MENATVLHFLAAVLEIGVVDLMLGADNALVIAMCCAALPPAHARAALVFGTGGAIVLRALLAAVAGTLLQVPYLKILAGAALAAIAIRLIVVNDRPEAGLPAPVASGGGHSTAAAGSPAMLGSILTFIAADAIVSLDNVIALGAIAQGSAALLIFGLLLSIPLLVFGGLLVMGLLRRHPVLIQVGGMALGWIAGQIAISDPAIVDWVERDAPAMAVAVPLLGVLLVLWESRICRAALSRGAA